MSDIFISHITEETEIAQKLKDLLNNVFTSRYEIFVCSNRQSIVAGTEWWESIKHGLKAFKTQILMISEDSENRSWVLFEAGAGWMRKESEQVVVIPACYGGKAKGNLKYPISSLQAINLNNSDDIKYMLTSMLQVLDSNLLNKNDQINILLNKFINEINEFANWVIDYSKNFELKKKTKNFKNIIHNLQQNFDNSNFTANLTLKQHPYYLQKGGVSIIDDLYEYSSFGIALTPYDCDKFAEEINCLKLKSVNVKTFNELIDIKYGRRMYKILQVHVTDKEITQLIRS